jgi:hypothetical protein
LGGRLVFRAPASCPGDSVRRASADVNGDASASRGEGDTRGGAHRTWRAAPREAGRWRLNYRSKNILYNGQPGRPDVHLQLVSLGVLPAKTALLEGSMSEQRFNTMLMRLESGRSRAATTARACAHGRTAAAQGPRRRPSSLAARCRSVARAHAPAAAAGHRCRSGGPLQSRRVALCGRAANVRARDAPSTGGLGHRPHVQNIA